MGNGVGRRPVPARIEVIGSLGGWRVSTATSQAPAGKGDQTTIRLVRARGTLAFDVGICLVLITLPTMALIVAIETVKGRKKFHPPLTTWFGTMLFAIVPLRNILPGAPPPGAWIDQALVLWVLIALVVAMVLYVEAWWKQSD
ncbi:putative transmembrane protein [Mycobacteroides abscessus MAB_030201_1075]|uniref:Putative transmembrane protein n=1 Tax=Mycobacteroides abscessus MAB_030201_1075 TaxID=1335410 RepID=A0A829PN42_9MYCO|nr:putative transmembrane protein [Mycobacteroides abscessus MAB_030201_1075]